MYYNQDMTYLQQDTGQVPSGYYGGGVAPVQVYPQGFPMDGQYMQYDQAYGRPDAIYENSQDAYRIPEAQWQYPVPNTFTGRYECFGPASQGQYGMINPVTAHICQTGKETERKKEKTKRCCGMC